MELVIILVTAGVTAVLSAVAGLGGGVILLVVLAQFFTPVVAIPIHGGIQMVSNGSRAFLLRKDVRWPAVGWGSLLLLPAAAVGVVVAKSLPEVATVLTLALFVLVVAWRPSLLRWKGGRPLPDKAMLVVGALSGFLNSTVGASGPVTSPFYKAVTVSHKAFVATAASSQVAAHVSKLVVFSAGGFDLRQHVTTIVGGAIAVVIGSWVGTRLLDKASINHLDLLFKVVLTVLACRLIIQAVV